MDTRLSGRFSRIFFFDCKHFLLIQIVKQKLADFIKKCRGFWILIFEMLIIQKPSLESCQVPHKIWARSVQPFWRLLDSKYKYRFEQISAVNNIKTQWIFLDYIQGDLNTGIQSPTKHDGSKTTYKQNSFIISTYI